MHAYACIAVWCGVVHAVCGKNAESTVPCIWCLQLPGQAKAAEQELAAASAVWAGAVDDEHEALLAVARAHIRNAAGD
jgi:hypothetical protein